MFEIILGAVVIILALAIVYGLFYITDWMNDVPSWLSGIGWLILIFIGGGLFALCAFVVGNAILSEWGG